MRPLPAGDPSQGSGADGRVEACQRGVSGEEDRPHRREGPRDLQAYLGRGLWGPGSGRDPGSARLDGRHGPARPAAVCPAGGRHVRLGQESGKWRIARWVSTGMFCVCISTHYNNQNCTFGVK